MFQGNDDRTADITRIHGFILKQQDDAGDQYDKAKTEGIFKAFAFAGNEIIDQYQQHDRRKAQHEVWLGHIGQKQKDKE